jgi:FAD/FMN-containing dehydrogenase
MLPSRTMSAVRATDPTSVFPGERIAPGDSRYPTLALGFNPRWVAHPRYIQLCADTTQVVEAVRDALQRQLRITVRAGGHCYEDFVADNHDGAIIDLSMMNGVYRDVDPRLCDSGELYCVEGGATLWNVYSELYRMYGVTLPGGSCYSVGAGGHFTGGGYGLLSRKHGLTIDYLHAVEIVCVNARGEVEAVTVSRESSAPDARALLWAQLGGGGGNFGIVTRFWFKDPPRAPRTAYLWNLAWDWSELDEQAFTELLSDYGHFLETNSEVGSPYSGLFSLLHLPQRVDSRSQIVLTMQYVGDDPSRLESFKREVTSSLPKATAQRAPVGYHHPPGGGAEAQELSWLWATQQLNGCTPNQRGKYKSAYMIRSFPDSQLAAIWKHLTQPSVKNPRSLLQIDSYGCQVNALSPNATAIPQRSSIMKLQYQAYWTEPAEDTANLAWIRAFYKDMYGPRGPVPDSTMDGCYVNYPDVDLPDWQDLYYKGNYAALQQVKQRWDPLDVFKHKQSIKLP